VIALLMAAALAPFSMSADRIEAERLAGGRVVQDASASGGRALQLLRDRSVRTVVSTAAPTYVRVRLRASACGGRVRVKGRTRRIARSGWRTVTVPLPAGASTVSFRRLGGCAVRMDRLDVIWTPAPTTTWQWQLTGPLDLSVPAELYDIDLFDTSAATVERIHAQGARAVCYFSAGTRERGRPDPFPASVAGKALEDWPDERWLDVRRLDVLAPILERRLDLCARKGFDGVEADNVDAYANDSGFPLRAADQLRFNRFLARAAHARGLSIGLKNDLDQVKTLEPAFDWALNEQCFQYEECDRLRPFTAAGKAVFVAEYELAPSAFCERARVAGLVAMRKRLELDAVREPCW
jgi:Glycoside-hydrolase family GH114